MIESKPCTDTSSFLDLLIRLVAEFHYRPVEFDIRRKECLVLDEYTTIFDPIFSTQESLHSPLVCIGSRIPLTAVQSPKLQIHPSAPSLECQTTDQLVVLVGISQHNIASYHTHVAHTPSVVRPFNPERK